MKQIKHTLSEKWAKRLTNAVKSVADETAGVKYCVVCGLRGRERKMKGKAIPMLMKVIREGEEAIELSCAHEM